MQDNGDHGIMQGYVKRKGINDVSPILATLFSPSKRNLNLIGGESNNFLSKENSAMKNGFASQRGLGPQGFENSRKK